MFKWMGNRVEMIVQMQLIRLLIKQTKGVFLIAGSM